MVQPSLTTIVAQFFILSTGNPTRLPLLFSAIYGIMLLQRGLWPSFGKEEVMDYTIILLILILLIIVIIKK